MKVLSMIDPLSYGVDAMRDIMLAFPTGAGGNGQDNFAFSLGQRRVSNRFFGDYDFRSRRGIQPEKLNFVAEILQTLIS